MQEREQVDQAKEAIKREEFYFDSSDGETGIRVLAWIPATAPRAIVQIAHGMVEHIERYDDFARMLAASGYVVFGNDHIGHGKSVLHVSELGELPVGGNDIMISDVDALRRIAQDRFPGIPYVLFGHSMGSFIARCYAGRHGAGLAGLILCGSGDQPRPVAFAGERLSRLIARASGWDYRSQFLHNMAVGSYAKRIPDATSPLAWLNTSEECVKRYADDPACGAMFSAGGYASLLSLVLEASSSGCLHGIPSELPILFVSGSCDPVGDMGKGVRNAAAALIASDHSDVEVRIYEGMRHEILDEPAHELVYADVLDWLEERL